MKQLLEAHRTVSRETVSRLEIYRDLLLRWNERINLVSRKDTQNIWARHVLDSLQLADLIPVGVRRAVDLGSGAGFPGLILAIATSIRFELIEADQRKAAFLREAARITEAPVLVYASRIEAAQLLPAALVTARALAPLPALLDLAHRFMAPGAVALFPKGGESDRELTEAGAKWKMKIERFQSRTDKDGVILKLSEVVRG